MFFFSIVIPTYNNLNKLKKTLLSLEKQKYKNFETIIIDDGSTDNTKNFFKNQYDKKKINLKYFYIKNSGGPATPRNIGIAKSNSLWICFLDSDDYWLSNKLFAVKKSIDQSNNSYDLYYHKEYLINNKNKKKIINYRSYSNNFYYNLIFKGNICSTSATVVNSNFLKKKKILFNESKKFISVEDYDFWLQIAYNNGRFKFIDKVLGVYKIHNNNLTKNILWHKKKNLLLIYYHIFYYQKKFKNKKKLWRKFLLIYYFELLLIKIIKLKKFKYIRSLIYLILIKPMIICYYIKRKF